MEKLISSSGKVIDLPVSSITDLESFRNRQQIRVDDLVESIRSIGQQNPIVVRRVKDSYQLISGFRRLTAVKQLGLPTVRAQVYDNLDTRKAYEISVAENLERHSLTPLDIVMTCKKLRDQERMGTKEISHVFKRDVRTIQRWLIVSEAIPEIKRAMAREQLSIQAAYEIIKSKTPLKELRERLGRNFSVRELRTIATTDNRRSPACITQKWFKNGNFTLAIRFRKNRDPKDEVIATLKETLTRLDGK